MAILSALLLIELKIAFYEDFKQVAELSSILSSSTISLLKYNPHSGRPSALNRSLLYPKTVSGRSFEVVIDR